MKPIGADASARQPIIVCNCTLNSTATFFALPTSARRKLHRFIVRYWPTVRAQLSSLKTGIGQPENVPMLLMWKTPRIGATGQFLTGATDLFLVAYLMP